MAYPQLLQGKTALITGASDGIGKVTARALAGMGARVIIVGRSPDKTLAAVDEIMRETGNPLVEALIADLSSLEQVRRLAGTVQQRTDHLHLLINNAGAIFMKRELSPDGFEMTLAVNHLAPFVLTNLLLGLMRASTPARIINVSSEAHRMARLNFADLQSERGYSPWKAYGQSKLANIYFTHGLAGFLDGDGVTANALHPGFVATNFGKSNGGVFRPIFAIFQAAALTPEEGARTTIHLASAPELEHVTGRYFVKCEETPSSPISNDMNAARKLWDCSLQLTGIATPA